MTMLFGAVWLLIAAIVLMFLPIWLALLWLKWGHRLWMRLSMVALWSLLTAAFAMTFYERYWRWPIASTSLAAVTIRMRV